METTLQHLLKDDLSLFAMPLYLNPWHHRVHHGSTVRYLVLAPG